MPCSLADVERAKSRAVAEATQLCWSIMFTVLKDNFGFSDDQIRRCWAQVEKLSEEIAEGRISVNDLRQVLREEYDIKLTR